MVRAAARTAAVPAGATVAAGAGAPATGGVPVGAAGGPSATSDAGGSADASGRASRLAASSAAVRGHAGVADAAGEAPSAPAPLGGSTAPVRRGRGGKKIAPAYAPCTEAAEAAVWAPSGAAVAHRGAESPAPPARVFGGMAEPGAPRCRRPAAP